jgi:hypothetical protein
MSCMSCMGAFASAACSKVPFYESRFSWIRKRETDMHTILLMRQLSVLFCLGLSFFFSVCSCVSCLSFLRVFALAVCPFSLCFFSMSFLP